MNHSTLEIKRAHITNWLTVVFMVYNKSEWSHFNYFTAHLRRDSWSSLHCSYLYSNFNKVESHKPIRSAVSNKSNNWHVQLSLTFPLEDCRKAVEIRTRVISQEHYHGAFKSTQNYPQVVLKKEKSKKVQPAVHELRNKSWKGQDRMIILLVFDEWWSCCCLSGPCGAQKVSTANRQSELRH